MLLHRPKPAEHFSFNFFFFFFSCPPYDSYLFFSFLLYFYCLFPIKKERKKKEMAGIFEQPRNADTLCMFSSSACINLKANNTIKSWEGRRSPVLMFASRMVCRVQDPLCHYFSNIYMCLFTVLATQSIANAIKSSFGPSGLDKMMVDDIGVLSLYSHCFLSWACLTLYPRSGCHSNE